jgi:hypothetical protein
MQLRFEGNQDELCTYLNTLTRVRKNHGEPTRSVQEGGLSLREDPASDVWSLTSIGTYRILTRIRQMIIVQLGILPRDVRPQGMTRWEWPRNGSCSRAESGPSHQELLDA